MRLTLGGILGLVTARLNNADKVGEKMAIEEINNAGEEILILLREAWNEKALEVEHADLVSGRNVYDWPEPVGDIVKLERYTADGGALVPLNRVQLGTDDVGPSGVISVWPPSGVFGYVLLPNRQLRILETPTATIEEGLRYTFYPRYLPMTKFTDVPRLPDAIHECLVPRALDRIRQHASVTLASEKNFESYRSRMETLLQSYIYPADSERSPRVDEEDSFYQEAN